MRRLLILLLLIGSAAAQESLQQQLSAMAERHAGKVALFAKQLKTGETVAVNADTPVKTASVIKLPVMLEAFYQVKSGRLDLHKRLKLRKHDQVQGSGVLTFMDTGLKPTLKDAITLMMIESDNTATDMVIDRLGGVHPVNSRLAAMGVKNTWLYKKVYQPAQEPMPADQKQFGLGKSTAREMAEVMSAIARCDLGDQKLCALMLSIMRHQQYRNMVPHYLETQDTSEEASDIADKIGMLDEARNDVALVETKNGPIVMAFFTWDNRDRRWVSENAAEVLIARMAMMIVESWSPQGLKSQKKERN